MSAATEPGHVRKAVLIAAVVPLMLRTAGNPGGLPKGVFDGIRAGVLADRSQFFKDLGATFYGANRPNSHRLPGAAGLVLRAAGHAGRSQGGARLHRGVLRDGLPEDLEKFDVPT